MKLRTRIFLLVGGLFAAAFIASQIFEASFSSHASNRTSLLISDKINLLNKDRQDHIATYLHDQIEKEKATINAVLTRITTNEFWRRFFGPSDLNIRTNLWLTSSFVLTYNKSLDLVQSVIGNKVTSEIIMSQAIQYRVHLVDFLDEVKLCVLDPQNPSQKIEGPFIAVPFNYNPEEGVEIELKEGRFSVNHESEQAYIFYTLDQVIAFDEKGFKSKMDDFCSHDLTSDYLADYPINTAEIVQLRQTLPIILDAITKAKQYLKANPNLYNYMTAQNQKWMMDHFRDLYHVPSTEKPTSLAEDNIKQRMSDISFIFDYTSLTSTGVFDYSPFAKDAPYGVCSVTANTQSGYGMTANRVFRSRPVETVTPSIFRDSTGRIFLGNYTEVNLILPVGLRQTIVTIGKDLFSILQGTAQLTERSLLLVVNDQVLMGLDADGNQISVETSQFPLASMLTKPTGFFKDSNQNECVFLTTKLFPDQNVYVVLYDLKAKEFEIVDIVSNSLSELKKRLTYQNLAIALITLIACVIAIDHLSKHITDPIAILAKNSKRLKDGQLEKVDLPAYENEPQDEIEDLYHCFGEMVDGLKEKEKVKGILNKVVSPQIAAKILEGSVALGGEEKVVTVLFADIRHFTQLTEKMRPAELIQVLNSFMTKLSEVVDKHNGVIDKYVGDEIMALFGAPIASSESALNAVQCAAEMISEVKEWNKQRINLHLFPIQIGIGVHTGNVVAGNVGAANRLNYTVLGANVNLASRLCDHAQEAQILISKETLESLKVKESIEYKALDPVVMKGFSEPIPIYQVLSCVHPISDSATIKS
jgi:class 3 adenylate cyclase